MSKKSVKGFILGVITTIMFTSLCMFAYGQQIEGTIKVIFGGVKVYVDSNKVNFNDTKGNKIEPITYNGTVYVPLRSFANSLGKNVGWSGKNWLGIEKRNDIYVGSRDLTSLSFTGKDGETHIPTGLWDMLRVYDNENTNETFKMLDKTYNTGIAARLYYQEPDAQLVFDLNSSYKNLIGTFGIPDDQDKENLKADKRNQDIYVQLKITGDGKQLYLSPKIGINDKPAEVSVDVYGVKQMKIDYIYSEKNDALTVGATVTAAFVNAKLN